MSVRSSLLAATILLVAILTACGRGEPTGSPPATTSAPVPISPSPTAAPTAHTAPSTSAPHADSTPATGQPPFVADTRPDTGEAEGPGPTSVAEVVTAGHGEGFDRVVFDIVGDGFAGWDVRYVDAATSQGSGAPVAVAGEAVLQVRLNNIGYPADVNGPTYDGPDRIRPHDTTAIREIVNDTIYEGEHVFFIGVADELPFRVFRLDGPQRVVVDVRHRR